MNNKCRQIVAFMYDKSDTKMIMQHIQQSLKQTTSNRVFYTLVAVGKAAKELLNVKYMPFINSNPANIRVFDLNKFRFSKAVPGVSFTNESRGNTLKETEIQNIATHFVRKDYVITGCTSKVQLDIANEFITRCNPVPVIGFSIGDEVSKRYLEALERPTFDSLLILHRAAHKELKVLISSKVCPSVKCVKPFPLSNSGKRNMRISCLRKSAEKIKVSPVNKIMTTEEVVREIFENDGVNNSRLVY